MHPIHTFKKKDLITYYKTYEITTLKKHVNVYHAMVGKT
jgi:hypothetical protein